MDRLIASNSVPLAQADTAPTTGTPQYATDGNPATSTPATLFPAYAWNMLQDEIYNVIIAAGLTPNRNAWNQLLTAIETMLQGSTTNVAVDTGAANAYVAAFTPALTAPAPWVPFWIKIAHANTGASTLNATGTVEPLVGGAHLALQGGEVVANGNALVYWNPTLASGAGSYVLMFCSGAAEQVAPATASQHAVQLGQATGRLLNTIIYINNAGTLQSSVNGAAFANVSSTYNPLSSLCNAVETEVLGGGAGGGGAAPTGAGQCSAGSGGGGGGWSKGRFSTGFTAVTVTVGAGGAATAGAAGTTGGSSSFGALISATGGAGGTLGGAAANTTNSINGGVGGGSGSGGQINAQGGVGPGAFYAATPISGKGGMSMYGEGAAPTSGTSAGNAAVSYGAGGSGGSLNAGSGSGAGGGAGKGGLVIVREYS